MSNNKETKKSTAQQWDKLIDVARKAYHESIPLAGTRIKTAIYADWNPIPKSVKKQNNPDIVSARRKTKKEQK